MLNLSNICYLAKTHPTLRIYGGKNIHAGKLLESKIPAETWEQVSLVQIRCHINAI